MIDPKRLVDLTHEFAHHPFCPTIAYADRERGVVVQVWDNATPGCKGTPWEGTLRVSIKHSRAKSREKMMARGYALPITWDDMQAIKDHFWPERYTNDGAELLPRVVSGEVLWVKCVFKWGDSYTCSYGFRYPMEQQS